LPAIVRSIGRSVKLIMTEWGSQVDESRRLAEALGVADLIAWSPPFNRVQLIRHLKSVDVVFDQIALPCFGGTAPQAIASNVPVIMSYDPVSTEWLIPEPAPILTAWSADEIATAVRAALDPAWRAQYETRGQNWYKRFHSSQQVVDKHAAAYLKVCRDTGLLSPA
jgi:glycosyltransferase involved in cell wall biosynthesis